MIIIPRKLLADELSLLQSAISKYVTMPILDTVRFEVTGDNLRLTASSIDVTLTSELPLPGLVNEPEILCVPIKPLAQLVSLFEGDEIRIERQAGRVRIQCGRSKHLLPLLDHTEFPATDTVEAETVTLSGELLASMLKHTAFAVFELANDVRQSDSKFTGLHWTLANGTLTIAATDKLRLAIARTPLTGAEFAVIVPQQVIPALKRFNAGQVEIGVSVNGNVMLVRAGSRQLTCRLLVDKPLDWPSLFPNTYDHTAEVDTTALTSALKRALVTSAERPSFVVNGLKWIATSNELTIESRDGDNGKSDEVVAISCPSLNGSAVCVGMNGAQVVDYLNLDVAGERTRLEITEGSHVVRLSPVAVKEFAYEYLVNTIGLRW